MRATRGGKLKPKRSWWQAEKSQVEKLAPKYRSGRPTLPSRSNNPFPIFQFVKVAVLQALITFLFEAGQ